MLEMQKKVMEDRNEINRKNEEAKKLKEELLEQKKLALEEKIKKNARERLVN
jgi:hypothetical protein